VKTIHFDGCEPYRKKDGTWDIRRYSYEEEYPDDRIRHCDMCTVCGFPAYPECTKTCNNGALDPDRKAVK